MSAIYIYTDERGDKYVFLMRIQDVKSFNINNSKLMPEAIFTVHVISIYTDDRQDIYDENSIS